MRYDKIADVMANKRFEQIKRFLYLSNNIKTLNVCPDNLFKFRPLLMH